MPATSMMPAGLSSGGRPRVPSAIRTPSTGTGRGWSGRLVALLAGAAALLVMGCRVGHFLESTTAVEQGYGGRIWTLLVYMNGDNELESEAIVSMNELESVDLSTRGVTTLVLLDRADGYDTSNGNWSGTRLFEVEHDPDGVNTRIVSTPIAAGELGLTAGGAEELDMGAPATLGRFLEFAERYYPAEHTALFLWGHGSGWRATGDEPSSVTVDVPARAVSFDDTSSSDPLYTRELGLALEGRELDVIGFDCCSEALIEVAYELRRCASYMVASEDVTRADGWSYRRLLERFGGSDLSPMGLLGAIVAAFADDEAATAGATISAVDLGAAEGVMSALDELSLQLWSWVDDTASQSELRSLLFEDVEDFYRIPGDLDLDLTDLGEIVAARVPAARNAAQLLIAAVGDAVVLEWHHAQGNPRAHGLAVHYVPLSTDGTAGVHADAYFRNLPVDFPLAFVADSSWVPQYPSGPGLLYRLWYEVF